MVARGFPESGRTSRTSSGVISRREVRPDIAQARSAGRDQRRYRRVVCPDRGLLRGGVLLPLIMMAYQRLSSCLILFWQFGDRGCEPLVHGGFPVVFEQASGRTHFQRPQRGASDSLQADDVGCPEGRTWGVLQAEGDGQAAPYLPESNSFAGTDVAHFQRLAQTAERGKLDSIFFADSPVLHGNVAQRPYGSLEPTVLLAAVTERIGLIATASTTYNEPYNLARRFASVDHISGGRAGWNVVTTAGDAAARNFSLAGQPAHSQRYERAEEFLDAAKKLWDSWEDDAVVADKGGGVWADSSRVHPANHQGPHFPGGGRPGRPQIRPGALGDYPGRLLGERQGLRSAVRGGRLHGAPDPAGCPRLLRRLETTDDGGGPGPAVHQDPAGHRSGHRRHGGRGAESGTGAGRTDPAGARGAAVGNLLRVSPESLKLDGQLPADLPSEDEIEGAKSRYTLVVNLARSEHLTVRQLIGRLGGGRGHSTFAGTPEQVADAIQHWFQSGAADGFNIMPPVLPSGLDIFVDQVVPILQDRGLFRREYTGRTLREHFGLAIPANSFERVPQPA